MERVLTGAEHGRALRCGAQVVGGLSEQTRRACIGQARAAGVYTGYTVVLDPGGGIVDVLWCGQHVAVIPRWALAGDDLVSLGEVPTVPDDASTLG